MATHATGPTATRPGWWRETARARPPRADLARDEDADVVVAGAGIVGLATAVLAAEAGLDVVVLEGRRIAAGTTGGTTGKLTVQNGTRLATLRARQGAEAAGAYARAGMRGLELFDGLVERHDIACDLERAPARLVAIDPSRVAEVDAEAAAADEAGVAITREPPGGLPMPAHASLTVPDQRQCHPVDLCLGLSDALETLGGRCYEASALLDLQRDRGARRWRVGCARGAVTTDHVVLATRLPTTHDRRLLFARAAPVSAAAVAARLDGAGPDGMLLLADADGRTWSARAAGEGRMVAVGASASTGDAEALGGRDTVLGDWVRAHWPGSEVTHAWMAQDQQPADGRPYIGPLTTGLHAATGFGKWGLAMGVAAAERLVAGIRSQPMPDEAYFAADRVRPADGWREALQAQVRVGRLLLGDRVSARGRLDGLAPGEGRVVRRATGAPVAACRTEDGAFHAVSAVCTHLGCLVRWNRDEQSWDCGCHGSRFAPDGTVLEAPADEPLHASGLVDPDER